MAKKFLCRMCLVKSVDVTKIFTEKYIRSRLAAIIGQHFWFEPKIDDPVSNMLCVPCMHQIESFHTYYQTIEEAQRKLAMFSSVKVEELGSSHNPSYIEVKEILKVENDTEDGLDTEVVDCLEDFREKTVVPICSIKPCFEEHFLTNEFDGVAGAAIKEEIIHDHKNDYSMIRATLAELKTVPLATNATAAVPESRGSENGANQDTVPADDERGDNSAVRAEEPSGEKIATRKRPVNTEMWLKTVVKSARQAGQAYINNKGKTVPSRKMKGGCGKTCRFKCEEKVTELERQELFAQFWGMVSHKEKWEFLARHVETKSVLSPTTNWKSRRKVTRCYTFRINGHVVKVCKSMFLNTLGINDQWVRTAIRKQGTGSAIEDDRRGKNNVRKTLHPDLVASVKKHIESFPKVPSCYCRKETNRECLNETLNVAKMHALYEIWMKSEHPDQTSIIATLRQYRDIFNTSFNLSFFKPKKDQCDVCFTYNSVKTTEENERLQLEYDTHIELKN